MALDDRFLHALGRITVNFQLLETHLAFLVWSLIGAEQRAGQIITSQMPFRTLCTLATSLFRYRVDNAELIEELDSIIARAAQAEDKRNALVHSLWLSGSQSEDTITRAKMTSRRKTGFRVSIQTLSEDELGEVADLMREVGEEIINFTVKMIDQGLISNPPLQ